MQQICVPAFIYLCFSLTQILIDTFKGLYNTAFFKFIVMVIFTILLNSLCRRGLGIISWIIVFVPFILMSVITTILLFVFGLNPATGKITYDGSQPVSYVGEDDADDITKNQQPVNNTQQYDARKDAVQSNANYDYDNYYGSTETNQQPASQQPASQQPASQQEDNEGHLSPPASTTGPTPEEPNTSYNPNDLSEQSAGTKDITDPNKNVPVNQRVNLDLLESFR